MFKHKMKPYKHQERANELARDKELFAYLCEMGTGKSKMLLDDIAQLYCEDKINAAVIIAPKGVYANWQNIEIPTHFTDTIPYKSHIWTGKTTQGETYDLKQHLEFFSGIKFLIVNVEVFSTSKRAMDYVNKFIATHNCLIAVDESTSIKNVKSKRTKNIMVMRNKTKYRRILTGSPITNSPMDLYTQFAFLNQRILGFGSWFAYRNFIAILKEMNLGVRSFRTIVGYDNEALEVVQQRIEPYSFRVTKKQCLDLPAKVYQKREIELSKEQKEAYLDMKENLRVSLVDDDIPYSSVTTVLTQIMKLHQIACGFIIGDNGEPKDIDGPNPRMNELLEILDECDKVIIWANYKYNIHQIEKAIKEKYSDIKDVCVTYHGGTSDAERARAIDLFQNNRSTRFFIANPQTAGYGLTLTAASTVIYYSNSYDIEKRQQSEDRAHRIGQKNSVNYIDITAKGTIDQKIIKSLETKTKLQDVVLKNGWKNLID